MEIQPNLQSVNRTIGDSAMQQKKNIKGTITSDGYREENDD